MLCDVCAEAFRSWLKARYGSLDEVNRRWWTAFWSHTYAWVRCPASSAPPIVTAYCGTITVDRC